MDKILLQASSPKESPKESLRTLRTIGAGGSVHMLTPKPAWLNYMHSLAARKYINPVAIGFVFLTFISSTD